MYWYIFIIIAVLSFFLIPNAFGGNRMVFSNRIRKSKYSNYDKWIEAMSKHETNNYRSMISEKYNNIFGMGYPFIRPSVNVGKTLEFIEGQNMSVYASRDQAIEDLLLWMDYNRFPADLKSVEAFANALRQKGYYTDSVDNYLKGLNRWL